MNEPQRPPGYKIPKFASAISTNSPIWENLVSLEDETAPKLPDSPLKEDIEDAHSKEARLAALKDPLSQYLKLAAGAAGVELTSFYIRVPDLQDPSADLNDFDALVDCLTPAAFHAFSETELYLSQLSSGRVVQVARLEQVAGLTVYKLAANLTGMLYNRNVQADPRRANPTKFNLLEEKKRLAQAIRRILDQLRTIFTVPQKFKRLRN